MLKPKMEAATPQPVRERDVIERSAQIVALCDSVCGGAIEHAEAREKLIEIVSLVRLRSEPAPEKWETLAAAATMIIEASDSADGQWLRTRLWSAAAPYLTQLEQAIKNEEQKRFAEMGLAVLTAQFCDTEYIIEVLRQAMSSGKDIRVYDDQEGE